MTYHSAEAGNLNTRLCTGLFGILLASSLAGCGSNIVVDAATIPTPLVEKIPASIGVRIPVEFENFVHEEKVIGREKWSIDLGRSNAAFFTQLFGYMFDKVTVVGPADDATLLDIDALIEPSIDAFEFSVPNQSKTTAFAVWIRYRLKVYDRAGTEIANWPVSAYGKSQKTTMGGSDALQSATILAMRDAAALMIMQLDKATGISLLVDAPAAVPDPAPLSFETTDDEVQATALEGLDDETG